MSLLTNFLKLFKYDPVADKDKTFNITQALNENWDKIDTKVEEISSAIENIEVPVTSVNNKTGDIVLSAADVGAASKQSFNEHLTETMPHKFTDTDTGKIYRYGLSVVNGVITMNYEEVV